MSSTASKGANRRSVRLVEPAFPKDDPQAYPGGEKSYKNAILYWMAHGAILSVSRTFGCHLHLWDDNVPPSKKRIYYGAAVLYEEQTAAPIKVASIPFSIVLCLEKERRIWIDPNDFKGRKTANAISVTRIKKTPAEPLWGEPKSRVEALIWLGARIERFSQSLHNGDSVGRLAAYERRLHYVEALPGCDICDGGEAQPFMKNACSACGETGFSPKAAA